MTVKYFFNFSDKLITKRHFFSESRPLGNSEDSGGGTDSQSHGAESGYSSEDSNTKTNVRQLGVKSVSSAGPCALPQTLALIILLLLLELEGLSPGTSMYLPC